MRSEDSDTATGTSEETAPEQGTAEQKQPSYEDTLLQLATEEGLMAPVEAEGQSPAEAPPPAQTEPESEPEETKSPETPAEGEDAQEGQEEEPQTAAEKKTIEEQIEEAKAKGEKPQWYLSRIAEETSKKQRANERADRIEAELAKAQEERDEARRQLSIASGPVATPESPLVDIQEPIVLDRLERVYELLEEVDLENVNEDGTVTVPSAIGRDGKMIYAKIDPEQARLAQKRADRILRKDIPNRRKYLAERAQIEAGASEWYPDLKDPNHGFTQMVNQLTGQVLSGTAMSNPEVKFWAANAVYGFIKRREENQTNNGKAEPSVKTIVDASKRKLAPTAPRTRTTVERKSSVDLAQAEKKFEKNPDDRDAAADYVGAVLSGKNRQKTVQPVAE